MESFGAYIKRLRIQSGLNQTELAAQVGLDSGGLSKIENGKKKLKENKLSLFAQAFNIEIEELKNQFFSEKFAQECFKYKCSNTVFQLAEKKAIYYKSTKVQQINLNL